MKNGCKFSNSDMLGLVLGHSRCLRARRIVGQAGFLVEEEVASAAAALANAPWNHETTLADHSFGWFHCCRKECVIRLQLGSRDAHIQSMKRSEMCPTGIESIHNRFNSQLLQSYVYYCQCKARLSIILC